MHDAFDSHSARPQADDQSQSAEDVRDRSKHVSVALALRGVIANIARIKLRRQAMNLVKQAAHERRD